jgi:GAF domain-containing protein
MTNTSETIAELPDAALLAAAFVDLARSVNEGRDMVEVFSMLAERCVAVLSVSACGILIVDSSGELEVIGSSNHSAHLLDLFQVQNVEGPCLLCCRTGDAVLDTELSETGSWPGFARVAREQGFAAVYAVPLSARGVVVGALNLFATLPLRDEEIAVAQALADAATIALLQADPHEDAVIVTRRLHVIVEERNTIEQAKGVLAQRFNIEAEAAFLQLRLAGERTGTRLIDVATSVVNRDTSYDAAHLLASPIE